MGGTGETPSPAGDDPAAAPFPRHRVLGTRFDLCDYAGVLDWLAAAPPGGPPAYLCVSNVADVMTARADPAYRQALEEADVVVPDGMPIVWALREDGYALETRVYGPDLMARALNDPRLAGRPQFLIGGRGVARDGVRRAFPDVRWAGELEPDFNALAERDYADLAAHLDAAGADILWVCLGGGRQVRFMHRLRPRLRRGVLLGVGAAFDFHAGLLPQAPPWMQRRGLEGVYRLLREPRRLWRRYLLLNPPFFYHRWRERRRRGG